ncbi:MAG: CpsD/CapB family tyrosine-protein kinase [Erysipelotrichaceae bacterium]|nr:CpsD/CapB family tyrosine-protein kinase [Erysipelotrichaceae bacterium]
MKCKIDNHNFEKYNMIAANIDSCTDNFKSIIFTSTLNDECCLETSINLAKAMVGMGKKILIIDTDIHSGGISKYFTLNDEFTLTDYFNDKCDITKIINKINENLDVVSIDNESFAVGMFNDKFKILIDSVKDKYDYILVNSSPIGNYADVNIMIKYIDASVLVVKKRRAKKDLLLEVIDKLKNYEKFGNKFLGAIFCEI